MNYKNQNKLFEKYKTRNFIRIFFLLGFLLVVIRLENFLYTAEDDCSYPDLVNNELVISEQPTEDWILTDYNDFSDYNECMTSHVYKTGILHSYKIAIYSYNYLIFLKIKTVSSDHFFSSNIISILQKNNIWHKSSEEGPAQVS